MLKPNATDGMMQLSVSPSGEWVLMGRNGLRPQTVMANPWLESLFPTERNVVLGANISLEEN